jgi:hypothetical protein
MEEPRRRRRPNFRGEFHPHEPSLRLALGIDSSEAERLIGVVHGVVTDYELGYIRRGLDPNELITKCLEVAYLRVRANKLPPMIDPIHKTVAIKELREAMKLNIADAAAIIGVTLRELRPLESWTASVSIGSREAAWCSYVRWARRRWTAQILLAKDAEWVLRVRRAAGAREELFRSFEQERELDERRQVRRLAYPPRFNKKAEAEARRLLGLDAPSA